MTFLMFYTLNNATLGVWLTGTLNLLHGCLSCVTISTKFEM